MKSLLSPDDESTDKLMGIDYKEIARVLAQIDPRNDTYEVLRGILTRLSRQPRERRSPSH